MAGVRRVGENPVMRQDAPAFPADPYAPRALLDPAERAAAIDEIDALPARLRAVVAPLDDAALDVPYRNWTLRQIVHHLADGQVNGYARFKWALTEARPTIKPYDEGCWAELVDARTLPVAPSLALLEGVHARWAVLLRAMSAADFGRAFHHPESGEDVMLATALDIYAWHGRHHLAQIAWRLRHPHDGT